MTAALIRVAPDRTVRKDFKECGDGALYRFNVSLKELNVHRNRAARVKVLLHNFEELPGVQIRRALYPRVQWIDSDAIEPFLRGHQVMAAIIDADLDLGVAEDIKVGLAKVSGSGLRHQRFDFHYSFTLHSWIDGHGASRNSGATADHKDRARVCRRQCRQVSQHSLKPHVPPHVRSLDFAGNVKGQDAAWKLRHGYRRIQSLAGVNDIALAYPGRRVTAIRHEQFRHGWHTVNQENGQYDG